MSNWCIAPRKTPSSCTLAPPPVGLAAHSFECCSMAVISARDQTSSSNQCRCDECWVVQVQFSMTSNIFRTYQGSEGPGGPGKNVFLHCKVAGHQLHKMDETSTNVNKCDVLEIPQLKLHWSYNSLYTFYIIYIYTCMIMCVYVCMSVCMSVCKYVCKYVCTYVRMYVRM